MNHFTLSLKKNKIGILLMIVSAFCTAFGQYFWKISDGSIMLLLLAGFFLYGLGAGCMIIAFKFGSFSVLHPMLSLGYILAMLIGYFFLNDVITINKIIGLIFILLGVIMLGVGDE